MSKNAVCCSALLIAACAGTAMAQPTVDGRIGTGESGLYGLAKWVNTIPTGFGDANAGGGGCNPADLGNPGAVATGIEYRIPLASIGNPAGAVRIVAFINGGGHDYVSNQILPGPSSNQFCNVGEPRSFDLTTVSGTQYATISPSAGGVPTVDGTRDAAYGAAVALQTTRTGFGNAAGGNAATANGSELDGMYAVVRGDSLYVMLTGNIESNFNKLELFIDSKAGGYQQLTGGFPDVDFNAINRMSTDGTNPGLKFDNGFAADYYITFGLGGDTNFYPNFATLDGSEFSGYLGCNQAGTGSGVINGCGGNNAVNLQIAINNSNADGVGSSCGTTPGTADVANGSELDAMYSYIDTAQNRLYIMLTGNLQNSNDSPCASGGNKLNLFIDADGASGQNQLRNDNVDISYGNLNRMGGNPGSTGLKFDAAFSPDYWMSIKAGDQCGRGWAVMDSAVLRTSGRLRNLDGYPLDYGAYDGGYRDTYFPVTYRGNFSPCNGNANIEDPQRQDGFTANIYTNYAPRGAAAALALVTYPAYPAGVPGRLSFATNNSNTAGITGSTANPADAIGVTTGFEISIDLAELGWDGTSDIKIGGFVSNGDATYLSNQVLGSLPAGTSNLGNLGATSGLDFTAIAGDQFVNISAFCAADFNGDGFTDFFDFDDFVLCFEGGACPPGKSADFNGDGFSDFFDFDDFVLAFETGC